MKCFECGDVGHKRSTCPHKEQATSNSGTGQQQHDALKGNSSPTHRGAVQRASGSMRVADSTTAGNLKVTNGGDRDRNHAH